MNAEMKSVHSDQELGSLIAEVAEDRRQMFEAIESYRPVNIETQEKGAFIEYRNGHPFYETLSGKIFSTRR